MTKIRDSAQLIETAARIFGEKGFENTSLDDVASALGVRRNSLYYYTSSKSDLFSMVLVHRLSELVGRIAYIASADGDPKDKLIEAIRAHILHTDRYYPESRVWIAPIAALQAGQVADDSGALLQDRLVTIFSDLIKQLMEAGEVPAAWNPKVIALGLLGICNWFTRWYRKGGDLSIDEIAGMLLQMIVNGLITGAAAPLPAGRSEAREVSLLANR